MRLQYHWPILFIEIVLSQVTVFLDGAIMLEKFMCSCQFYACAFINSAVLPLLIIMFVIGLHGRPRYKATTVNLVPICILTYRSMYSVYYT